MRRSLRRNLAAFIAALVLGAGVSAPSTADAHLATFGSWEVTRDYLGELFPKASRFMVKRHELSAPEVATIEKTLGFKLYPEDRTPTFYVAIDESSGKKRFLGVAIFIDPRLAPKIVGGAALRLEVGIAVDARGAISNIKVFDYRGDLALTRPAFLDQFRGKTLKNDFKVGAEVAPVEGEEEESQLVANAAKEALYLMKVALGKGKK